jgi:putative phosphoesterase
MKVALIGDIHANLPALEAVLAHAREQGATAVWNVGDFVGYGAFPEEVVQQLQGEYVLSTIGSYDRDVLRFEKRESSWRQKKVLEEYLVLKWTSERLSKRSRKYLRFLSREIRMTVGGRRVLLTHTSPGSGKEYLTLGTSDEELREIAGAAQADVIVSGHSHRPFARQIDGVWFINPGSTGHPQDGDPRASYATLEFDSDLHVELFRVEYDVDSLVSALREHGLPEAVCRMFLLACDLDTALAAGDPS